MIYSAGHVFHRHHGGPQHWAPSIISGSFFISHKLTPRISKSAGGRRRRGWDPLSSIQTSHEPLQCQALPVSTSLPISCNSVSAPTNESASDTYLSADKSFWALLSARFSTTLVLFLLGLVTEIIFSHWQVGRYSGGHQMSHSQGLSQRQTC